eukprot:1448633-Prymnesium_polylepis.1
MPFRLAENGSAESVSRTDARTHGPCTASRFENLRGLICESPCVHSVVATVCNLVGGPSGHAIVDRPRCKNAAPRPTRSTAHRHRATRTRARQ